MKKEIIFKMIIIFMIGIILFAMPTNVFAADLDDEDIFGDLDDDPYEDLTGGTNNVDDEKKEETKLDTNNTNNTNTNTNTNTNYNTDLPKAGVAENTIMVVSIVVLGITAIYAYRKVNTYKNV